MAHPPHALAAVASENELSFGRHPFDPRSSELTRAREVMQADGLNALELDAAATENRREEVARFERAAERLLPSWAGPDEMLDLGLANALPQLPPPTRACAVITAAPASPAASAPSAKRASSTSADEPTEGYEALTGLNLAGLKQTWASLWEHVRSALAPRRRRLLAGATACLVLGAAWAGLSAEDEPVRAPKQAAAPVASAPVAIPHAPVAAVPTREVLPPARAEPTVQTPAEKVAPAKVAPARKRHVRRATKPKVALAKAGSAKAGSAKAGSAKAGSAKEPSAKPLPAPAKKPAPRRRNAR